MNLKRNKIKNTHPGGWKRFLSASILYFFPITCQLLWLTNCATYRKWVYRGAIIDSLNIRTKKMERENRKAFAELRADMLTQIEKLTLRIEELANKMDETQEQLAKVRRKMIGERPLPETLIKRDTLFLQPDETKAEEIYQIAYQDVMRGEYDIAIEGFRNFLSKYPNTELSDNAQYWLGECYYAKGDYKNGKIEFEKVIANYPKGNKVASALYKLGIIHLNLGEKNKAGEYFNKLIKEYSTSPEAKLAKEKLKEW